MYIIVCKSKCNALHTWIYWHHYTTKPDDKVDKLDYDNNTYMTL